jgi:hypothetical protein
MEFKRQGAKIASSRAEIDQKRDENAESGTLMLYGGFFRQNFARPLDMLTACAGI